MSLTPGRKRRHRHLTARRANLSEVQDESRVEELVAYLYSPSISLNVDDITNHNLFFEDGLVNTRVQSQLLGTLHSFEAENNV